MWRRTAVHLFVVVAVATAYPGTIGPTRAAERAKPLPYHAREAMKQLDNVFRRIDGTYEFVEKYKDDPSITADQHQRKLDTIEQQIELLQPLLDKAREAAEKGGAKDHPALAEAQAKIDAQPERLQKAKEALLKQRQQATADTALATADAEEIVKAEKRLKEDLLDKLTEAAYKDPVKDLEELKALPGRVAQFNAEQPKLKELVDRFGAKHGTTEDAIRASLKKAGYEGQDFVVANAYLALRESGEKVAQVSNATAEAIAKRATENLSADRLKGIHDFFLMAQPVHEYAAAMQVARQLAPENQKVTEAARQVDQAVKGLQATLDARVAKRKWPAQAASAPANAKALASTALAYFRTSTDWGRRSENAEAKDKEPRRPLAVVVTGAWSVQAKNILGQPTMYGLPIALAVQLDSEKAKNLVRVYHLTMRTAEKAGVKAAPPFSSVTVGDSYYIRASTPPAKP